MKTITYDDYLRLMGLLLIAADHRKALAAIERSAQLLLQDTDDGGHTSETVWGGYHRTAQHLLEILDITVEEPTKE